MPIPNIKTPSLSDRLKTLGVTVGTQNIQPPKPRLDEEYPIDQVLAGDFWHTPSGDVFVVETNYKADFLRGSIKLKSSSPLDIIAAYARFPQIADLPIEQFAFVDIVGIFCVCNPECIVAGISQVVGHHIAP